jgi:hypothetical protein
MPVLETAALIASIAGAAASSVSAAKDTGDAVQHQRTVKKVPQSPFHTLRTRTHVIHQYGKTEITEDRYCRTHGDADAGVTADGGLWASSRDNGSAMASISYKKK